MQFANTELEFIKFQSREKLKTFQCKKKIFACLVTEPEWCPFQKSLQQYFYLVVVVMQVLLKYVFQEIIKSFWKFYYVLRKITVGP